MDSILSIVLVDDHKVVRAGIRTLLETSHDLRVVGEADTGREGVRMVERTRPDVVILDLQMPDMSGVEVCSRISSVAPETKVLILSAFLNAQLLKGCLEAGAAGYLMKDAENLDIVAAVRSIAAGNTVFDRRVDMLEHALGRERHDSFGVLSPRELQVLGLLCRGFTNQEIAEELDMSLNTVKGHVKEIMRKLDCRNRVEVVVWAREHHLI